MQKRLFYKFYINKNFFIKKTINSFKTYKKLFNITWITSHYYLYINNKFIQLNKLNNYLIYFNKEILEYALKIKNKWKNLNLKLFKLQNKIIYFNFILYYKKIYNLLKFEILYLWKILINKEIKLSYDFIWNFKTNNGLFFTFKNKKKNYTFLSLGFFIKFFEKKKSLKKNKILKLLAIKFFKKLFSLIKKIQLMLIIKKNPIFLLELITYFNQPITIIEKNKNTINNNLNQNIKKLK